MALVHLRTKQLVTSYNLFKAVVSDASLKMGSAVLMRRLKKLLMEDFNGRTSAGVKAFENSRPRCSMKFVNHTKQSLSLGGLGSTKYLDTCLYLERVLVNNEVSKPLKTHATHTPTSLEVRFDFSSMYV